MLTRSPVTATWSGAWALRSRTSASTCAARWILWRVLRQCSQPSTRLPARSAGLGVGGGAGGGGGGKMWGEEKGKGREGGGARPPFFSLPPFRFYELPINMPARKTSTPP